MEDSTPGPKVIDVLYETASSELSNLASKAIDEQLDLTNTRLAELFASMAQRAYTRGLQDGYVQGVRDQKEREEV